MSAPTDFFRYILQRGLAMIDSVGLRLSIPPGATVSVDYAPATTGEVWLVYYMSFGDIPSDTFTLTVRFMQSKYGGRAYYQVFDPLGYDAINVGLILWCPTVKGNPLELKITNLDTATQVFSARLWQLRILERDMPLILSLFDEYVRRAR
jgi:hypothetical protein